MPRNFADRLLDKIDEMQNPSCVGLDPRVNAIPVYIIKDAIKNTCDSSSKGLERLSVGDALAATGEAIYLFNAQIIDKTFDIAGVYKPQMAFYEQYGSAGVRAFERTVNYAKSKAQ